MSPTRARQALRANFPKLAVRTITLAGEGEDSCAMVVNGRHIFRFPKFASSARKLRVELTLLPSLQPYLTIPIPDIRFIGKLRPSGWPFVGYPFVPGVSLTRRRFERMKPSAQRFILRQLADLLRAVHATPARRAHRLGVPLVDCRQYYRGLFGRARQYLLPGLPRWACRHIEASFSAYLNEAANFRYAPTLLHADISPEHLLCHPRTGRITGVIDWGDAQISDPDRELIYLYDDYGPRFLDNFLNYWPHPTHERLRRKLEFFLLADDVRAFLNGVTRPDRRLAARGKRWLLRCARRQLTSQPR